MATRKKKRAARAPRDRDADEAAYQRIVDYYERDAYLVRPSGTGWVAQTIWDHNLFEDGRAEFVGTTGATAREAVDELEQLKGRALHPSSYRDREAVEKNVVVVIPPAVIESDQEAEDWLRKSPEEAYTENMQYEPNARRYKTYFLHVDCSPPTPGPSTPQKANDYLQDIEDLVGRRVASITDPTDARPFYRITFEFKKRESLNYALCQLIDNMPELARRQSEADWIVYHVVGPVDATTALAETGGG